MTSPNDSLLIELFWELRDAGLPLRIDDYQLLCQAWEKGFCPKDYQELRQLCQRLWVKSLKEKQLFEKYFDGYFEKYSVQYLQQYLFPADEDVSLIAKPPRTKEAKQPGGAKTQNRETTTPELPIQPSQPEIEVSDSTEELLVVQAVPLQHTSKQIPSNRFSLTHEYFPVTRRQMQQGWRKLRQPVREGALVELDIPATVKRVSKQGFFLEPVLINRQANQTELLLLFDRSNSMMPFAPLAEQLVETEQQDGRLEQTKTYYFRNAPGDFLFSDLDLLQKQTLTEIIPHLHKNRTVVLIFSDGGAARGGLNPKRVEFTAQFLSQIRPVVKNIAWLNPLPANRWRGTTATEVARLVSMYPFSKPDWRRMMNELRGRQIPPAMFDHSTDNSEVAVDWKFVEEVQERLNRLQPVHAFSDEDEFSRYESAADRIVDFAMYGQGYLYFACHAAFPLALTPHLLYYLRENFPFFNQQGKRLDLDWLVVPDFLLSNLCHPAGYQLYEMPSAVRHLLLKLLQSDERFGDQQLEKLSECLLFYLQQKLRNTHLDIKDFGKNPEWIALAYTKPTEVARQLALMLHQTYSGDKAEKIKSVSLTATFAEPLAEANFQPLLTFARAWGRLARGYEEEAKELFEQLPKKSPELNIEGVKLWIPGRKLPQFSFDVVTVNATGEIIKRETHQAKYFKEDLGNRVTLDMVYIPGGSFLMGSPETEEGRYENEESPQHEVTVQLFFMGKYPVTQKQWRVVAAFPQVNRELNPNPSNFKGVNRPVESISWYDAVEFCARLSTYTGKNYRLPSEAEWEYASRAGTTTPFHFGETITPELANYNGNYTYASGFKGECREKTTTVGSFKVANAFGLFDMHGNIWEWCADDWHENYENAPSDGSAWLNQSLKDNDNCRMLRSASWLNHPRYCRSASRDNDDPDYSYGNIGVRVVVSGART